MDGGGLFVGRDGVLASIRDRLAGVVDAVPAVVVVTGDAGVGKSRLLRESLGLLSGETAVGFGAAPGPGGGGPPFGLWGPVAEDLLGSVDADPTAACRTLGVDAAALAHLLPGVHAVQAAEPREPVTDVEPALVRLVRAVAARRPVVVALDDLHWADDASLRVTTTLVSLLREDRLGVLVAAREDGDASGRLHAVLDRLMRWQHADQVHLEGLTRPDAQRLLETMGVEDCRREEVLRLAEGNPFLLTQLGTAPPGVVPGPAARLLTSPLTGLEDHTRAAVHLLAVSAGPVPDTVVTSAVSMLGVSDPDDALEQALQAGVAVAGRRRGTVGLRHSLLADAALTQLTDEDRVVLHGALLDAWTDPATPTPDPAVAARHAQHAGRPRDALRYELQAAQAARLVGAFTDAEPHLDAAGELWEQLRPESVDGLDEAGLWEMRLRNSEGCCDTDKELRLIDTARGTACGHDMGVRLDVRRAGALMTQLRMNEAIDVLTATLPRLTDMADRLEAIAKLAWMQPTVARPLLTGDLVREAVHIADQLGDPTSHGLATIVAAAVQTDPDQRLRLLERAETIFGEAGLVTMVEPAMWAQMHVLRNAGRDHDALRLRHRMLTWLQSAADDFARDARAEWAAMAADILETQGHWQQARDLVDDARWHGLSFDTEYYLTIMRQRLAALTVGMRPDLWPDPASISFGENRREIAALEYAYWARHWEVGVPAALADPVEPFENELPRIAWLRTRLLVDAGVEPERDWPAVARPPHPQLVPATPADQEGMGQLCRAEQQRSLGADTCDQWMTAASLLDQAERPYPATYARWRACQSLLRDGHRDQTPALLREAHHQAHALPHPALADQIAALGRQARIPLRRPAPHTSHLPAALARLTDREREVLALVACGRTNGEIADELVISTKTASVHVSNILTKLAVTSRYAAAAIYDQHTQSSSTPERMS